MAATRPIESLPFEVRHQRASFPGAINPA